MTTRISPKGMTRVQFLDHFAGLLNSCIHHEQITVVRDHFNDRVYSLIPEKDVVEAIHVFDYLYEVAMKNVIKKNFANQ